MNPQVTIAITAWNRADMVGDAVRSALRSDFPDYEVLVVDNCSNDDTVEAARQAARGDPRVKIHVNESNLGDYGNRNRALSLATGTYLKYLDSDDLLYPHTLDVLLRMLESEPGAAFALSTGIAWPGGPYPMRLSPRLAYEREFLGAGLFRCGPSSALFRTQVLRDLGGFQDVGPLSDYHFYLRACRAVDVVLAPADLFWTRVHPQQELNSAKITPARREALRAGWEALRSDDCPLRPADRRRARANHLVSLVRLAAKDLRRGRVAAALAWMGRTGPRFGDYVADIWFRGRNTLAGTPRTADGAYRMPAWLDGDVEAEHEG